ncbi:unnamed protein product [Lactuca saligna]|uniref:Transposase MuDR plant domain-containing protein n=1 Tax=Lactuca saligna TaxID=75948 RepID=A0AA35Z938_LACSI|nr:unnamed protein product [Lactuca saligna]
MISSPFLKSLLSGVCKDVYYCPHEVRLSEGLHAIRNDCDFNEFLEYMNEKKRFDVYVDHHHEPLFDRIQEEKADLEDEDLVSIDDVESILEDGLKTEHVEDDEVISLKRNFNDPFLNKLCPIQNDDLVEEDRNVIRPIYPRHDHTQEWNQMKPRLGMKYSTTAKLKYSLSCYAVVNGYDLWYEKNDNTRLLVRCCKGKNPTCPFRLYTSWIKEEHTFQIKSLITEHKCSRAFKLGSIVTYKWIGKQFVNDVLESPKLCLRKMKALVSKIYNINVSVGQCRNAKELALSEVEGSLKEHYAKLWDHAAAIRRANPGSHVEVFLEPQHDSNMVFYRFYVSFKGVVDGWLHRCRKVIGVDGCFLKGVCRGELLSAVGRDANNNIYPLAWPVVNVENKRTWKWFLENLMEDIGGNGHGITILSDGHKKQSGLSWDLDICPSIRKEIEDLKELKRFWVPYVSGYKEFEVFSGNKSYEYNIHPLNDNSEWPYVEGLHTILPPLKRRLHGRPCVKRKIDQAERELSGHTRHTVSRAGIPLRCTICQQTGHNKATCPSKPTPAPSTTTPSHSTPAPVKRIHVKKAHVKKGPVKKGPCEEKSCEEGSFE